MLPLGFGALAAGALALIAGVTGSSLASVLRGKPDKSKAAGPAANVGAGEASAALQAPQGEPSTGNVSEEQFARQLLARIGVNPTRSAIEKLKAWMAQEGGNWHNTARFNPLNTTLAEPGATAINSVGVKAYGSWGQGIEATARTLAGYPQIIAALRHGSLDQFKATVSGSQWGTKF